MFDHVVLVFIFLNCITIALERPDIDPGSTVSPRRQLALWVGQGEVDMDFPLVFPCRNGPFSASPTTSSQPSLWWR